MDALQSADEFRFAARRQANRRRRRFARHPAEGFHVARDAADRIGRTAQQVDGAVAVVVHGVAPVAGRHELRQAHRPGVRALDDERIHSGLARQQQQFFQFVAEVVLAAHAVEGDRGQRIDGAERARVAAERGFDAEDSQDHLGGNAELRFGAGQVFGVQRPEARAGGNQVRRQEFRAITRVRTRRRGSRARRRADQAHRCRRVANVTQDPLEVRAVDAVLFAHRIDERAHVGAREVIRASTRLHREQARGEQERRHHLRCYGFHSARSREISERLKVKPMRACGR